MRLTGKIALISGGCSGIGLATALRFLEEGARVVVGDVNESAFHRISEKIADADERLEFVRLDVTKEQDWISAYHQVIEIFGGVNVVINSAGIGLLGTIEDMSLDDWNKELAVNLTGTFLGMKYGFQHMKQTGGSIINLSSIEGIVGTDKYVAYSADKAGVRNLTKSAALHAGRQGYGIRVNSVHPGYIKTPMLGDDQEELRKLATLHPIGHIGEANDVANMILFLASDESKFATGAEFVVDGGFLAQ